MASALHTKVYATADHNKSTLDISLIYAYRFVLAIVDCCLLPVTLPLPLGVVRTNVTDITPIKLSVTIKYMPYHVR